MLIDVRTNLREEEAPDMLAALALGLGEGVARDLALALEKAGHGPPRARPVPEDTHPEEAREPIVRLIMDQWRARHRGLQRLMRGNLGRLAGLFQRRVVHQAPGTRATPADLLGEAPWLLAASREMLTQSYAALVTPTDGWQLPADLKEAWEMAGLRVPVVTVATLQTASFNAGAYAGLSGSEAPTSMLDKLEETERRILEPAEIALARQFAHVRAGSAIARLGAGVADQTATRELAALQETAKTFLTEEITEAGWRTLRTRLQDAVRSASADHAHDYDRDLDRIAASETRYAYNAGRIAALAQEGIAAVRYVVSPTACAHCRRVLLEEDGTTPRVFPLAAILAEIRAHGGLNVGRPAADWKPGLLVHPWCACRPERADIPAVPWRPHS